MENSDWLRRQGHRLLQFGMLLFLFALLIGLVVPKFTLPRMGLAAHILGIMQGIFLIAMGLLWTRLKLTKAVSRVAFVLVVYGCFAAWTANLLAGIWSAGGAMLPMSAGQARGSAFQE